MRALLLIGALVALLLVFVPPIHSNAYRYEFVETIQFDLAAFAVPALFVLGWPLRLVHGEPEHRLRRWAARLSDARRRHPSMWRSLGFALFYVVFLIIWRSPPLMNALERHRWLLVLEVLSLLVTGTVVWVELVRSPPLEPRLPPPWRGVAAALTMWSVWVTAYVIGFSHVSWYVAYHHAAGGLGTSADQELSTGALWFGAAVAFVPVVFSDLMAWLRDDDDPDAELRQIVRRERRWGEPD